MRKIIFVFLFALVLLGCSFAADKLLFKLTDPVGDDHGPGSYIYPTNPVFRPGSFDLTGFEVHESESDVIFKVYFKNWFTIPPDLQISNEKNLKNFFKTNLFLQNVDIYIDRDHKYNSGITSMIPGRNAKVAPESAWEQAIFIAPQPYLARSEMGRLAKEMAGRVIVPASYDIGDNYVQFKISKKIIGQPTEKWGYLVFVTGAEWETTAFSLSNWMQYGSSYEEPVLNRIVDRYPSEWEFGGGDPSGAAPNIIDMFVASGESQEKMLGSYDTKTNKRATIFAVYPFSSSLEVEKKPTKEAFAGEMEVVDVLKNVVVVNAGRESGIFVGKLGQVYDGNGALVAAVIVEEVREKVSICTVVPMTQTVEIVAGMKVKFK
jgi:carbohydrate-binding DOMON domain-containing protein